MMKRSKTFIIVLALISVNIGIPHALAVFVNGVERFDGTVKDTTTWEEYAKYGSVVSQDNQLILDAVPSNTMDYTTKNVMVGIGETISVELISHPEGVAESILYLTTNSEGTNVFTAIDSHYLYIEYSYWPPLDEFHFVAGSGGSGSGGGIVFDKDTPPPSPGNPYILQIERTSSTSAIFSAFTSDMTLIGSQFLPFTDVPDRLFISLSTWSELGNPAIFDNVTIIPEPATLLLLTMGVLVLKSRSRQ